MIIRTILAVLVVVALLALLAPLFRILGFPLTADVEFVLRILIALGALFYILRGGDITIFRRP